MRKVQRSACAPVKGGGEVSKSVATRMPDLRVTCSTATSGTTATVGSTTVDSVRGAGRESPMVQQVGGVLVERSGPPDWDDISAIIGQSGGQCIELGVNEKTWAHIVSERAGTRNNASKVAET